ncbi:MAG: hypothetical protein KA533_03540 [Sphingobium sp.]|nr:hypothetical protein [Sphingobium sp.]MBP6111556.1 hypothetical protein [Sphingobium sp.]MBP8670515.1 hypothetical protein [Sphingobium sp.]MBP9157288.1 hypothetical protein [Sphingobium sp.]MCC6482564.1 hypothetical protein [Sphingomonadaceae bacterium]
MSTVADQNGFQEPHGNRIIQIGLIVVGSLLALWLMWYLYSALTGVHSVAVKNETPVISPLLPPPPPPPPPPPKAEEKPPEPSPDKVTSTPEPKPQAPAPMQMNAEAQAGAAGGIAAGSGGGIGSPSSTGTCVGPNCGIGKGGITDGFYARALSSALQARVQRDSKLSRMVFSADFAIWVSSSGAVTRAELVSSSGDSKRDAMLKTLIEGASGLDAPPASFKFPRRITVKGRRSL